MREPETLPADSGPRRKGTISRGRLALLVATSTLSAIGLGSAALMACAPVGGGDALLIASPTQDLGRLDPGAVCAVNYIVRNDTKSNIFVVGSQVSCSCATLKNPLPYSIPGGGEGTLELRVRAPRDPGAFRLSLEVFTDCPAQPRLRLVTKGEVKGIQTH